MHAGVYDFASLVNETPLEIPVFQSEYSWGDVQWRRFFYELKHAFDHNSAYFLGTLLIKNFQNFSSKTRVLLDGEQRITTFAVLLKALFDQLDSTEDSDLFEELKNLLFKNFADRIPKITHSRLNQKAFETVFKVNNASEIADLKINNNAIINCYRHFSNSVQQYENFYFRHFLSFLLHNKCWVVLGLEETDNAQIVFDVVNFAHQRSAAAQIIQNALFDKVRDMFGADSFEDFYQEFWVDIFEKDDITHAFWQGNDKRGYPQIEGFLKVFAIIADFFNPEEHVFNDLSAQYNSKLDSFFSKDDLLAFLNLFKEYAELWFEWGSLEAVGKGFEDYECRLFQIVHLTELSLLPLILKLKYVLRENPEELKGVCDLISGVLCQTYINTNMIPSTNAEYLNLMKDLNKDAPLEFLRNHFSSKRKNNTTATGVKKVVRRVVHR